MTMTMALSLQRTMFVYFERLMVRQTNTIAAVDNRPLIVDASLPLIELADDNNFH